MKEKIESLLDKIASAKEENKLLQSSFTNLIFWLQSEMLPEWALDSIDELVIAQEWDEINDRFYKNINFGTAGMRGRTIANKSTSVEKGSDSLDGEYKYPAVGSACLNDFNIIRSTVGLFNYSKEHLENSEIPKTPRLVVGHDMRYFSKHFCDLVASTWTLLGGEVFIFDGPRSTPQLSFSVRHLQATAGVMITASHNPFHDNGYKVYFEDGAQISDSHAKNIVSAIENVNFSEIKEFLDKDLTKVVILNPLMDESYIDCVKKVFLDKESIKSHMPHVVFSPIHGTGGITVFPLVKRMELKISTVDEQTKMDPRFSTVELPNPENQDVFKLGIEKADEVGADAVIASDPDADRMGAVVKSEQGEWITLNGNDIAVALAEYRIQKMIEMKWLPKKKEKRSTAAIIKSFVTTPMLKEIADEYGLKLVETLTGFKWIGAKLLDYELTLQDRLKKTQGLSIHYDKTTIKKRKDLLMRHSTFYVFGGEESFGYLASDTVRDKDANASVMMFCELLSHLKKTETPFNVYLDSLYCKYGYHKEDLLSLNYKGPDGAEKIKRILNFYKNRHHKRINDVRILSFNDFGKENIEDADGKMIPKQDFYIIKLLDGYSIAIRGSGTEPKIKFYLFGKSDVDNPDKLPKIKKEVNEKLASLKTWLKEDAEAIAG